MRICSTFESDTVGDQVGGKFSQDSINLIDGDIYFYNYFDKN